MSGAKVNEKRVDVQLTDYYRNLVYYNYNMNTLDNWYRLDNTAKIFPAVTTRKNSSTFRVSVKLKETVNPVLLQESLDIVLPRFPMFKVRLRRGFFWYFLETNDDRLLVYKEDNAPCSIIDKLENNGYLLRILYFNDKISVEFFHSITDGFGAVEFVKLLILEYVKRTGFSIDSRGKILSVKDMISPSETEDSFKSYFRTTDTELPKEPAAYKIKGSRFNNFGNNIIKLLFEADAVKTVSRKYGVTITEFIVGLFVYSILREKLKTTRDTNPINIVVPVNLRKLFPSSTLRNFFSIITVSISTNSEISLASLLQEVSGQFKSKITTEKLLHDMSAHYKAEKLLVIKVVPLFIKNMILRLSFINGTKLQTASVSNVGRIELPDEMKQFVDHMEVILYSSRKNVLNCGICSVNNTLAITFSRTILEPNIIRNFVDYLTGNEGVEVKISSNQWGLYNE